MTRILAAVTALALSFSPVAASSENITMMIVKPENKPSVSAIDLADAGTTAVAIATGRFTEANPIVGIAGDEVAPLVSLALKVGAKKFMIANGATPEQADYYVGAGSAFGAGNNMTLLLGGTGPLGIAAGILMTLAYLDLNNPENPKSKEPNWDNWHARETR